MRLKAVSTCFIMFLSLNLFCQNDIWERIEDYDKLETRKSVDNGMAYPKSYSLLTINDDNMKAVLNSTPKRTDKLERESLPILNVPLPNGESLQFYIEEASIMDPKLQNKFPNIKSYAGYGVDQKDCYLRFDVSPKGYHFQVLSSEYGTIKIEPVKSDNQNYQCYFKKDVLVKDKDYSFVCEFDDKMHVPEEYTPIASSKFLQGDNDLRDYRLVVACTGEYTDYHGGTVADAMSAINTTINRVVGIYEREFSITMTLISNNEDVIYTDGMTDPFTNGNASMMIDENRDNMNAVIGSANFDIGHLFGTSGSGLAYLNGPCGNNKARATSAIANPIGEFFDVDYVCHEMGHQFGANHTQYNACNKNNATAMEPGSGSTIMAYAGICPPNVQSNSDDYFHAVSIEEIENFTTTGAGNNCPTSTNLGNSFPTVSAGTNYTIPKSTPFILSADANDPDGDILTYCWEQIDNSGSEAQPPESDNNNGPMFRSFDPTTDNQRFFPALPVVISGEDSDWEVLPSITRDLNFRVTVRDNASGNGLTEEDDCLVSVSGISGPFVVTNPNTGVQWNTGESKTVSWNVANTNNAPVSCANVDIMLSVDGGFTYTTTLASGVANNGSYNIVVPNLVSSFARLRVMCSDNIFYDISDVDFGLNSPPFPEYCEVMYNNNNCTTGDYINDVSFNTISNLGTGCSITGDNYSDYTNLKTIVENGLTYTLTVKPNSNYAQYMAGFIDWNLDGDFEDTDEFYDIGHVEEGVEEDISITIPAGAVMGEKLLRVMCRYGTDPLVAQDACSSGFDYGEIEDYLIEVADPCNLNVTVTQNFNSGENEIVSASNNVTASNVINSGANIIYSAGMEIDLNNGFEVKAGAVFEAYIGPCQ